MKYPKNKKSSRGVSIIEIVVSMILLFVVMLVLAFVYPNGRRLTESTDKRTKATEIAKAIMEEIQLVPLYPQKALNANSFTNVSLVKTSQDNNTKLLGNLTLADMTSFKWPYHQLISSVDAGGAETWDANVDKLTNAKCPFFIFSGNSVSALKTKIIANQVRPFFLNLNDVQVDATLTLPKGIQVYPNGNNVYQPNERIPVIATILVSIGWGNSTSDGHWSYNYIQLVNTRTENIY